MKSYRWAIMVIIVLALLLIATVGYIAFTSYREKTLDKEFSIYQLGAEFGYEQAVLQLFQQAMTCEPVPIRVENDTLSMIAIECLQ